MYLIINNLKFAWESINENKLKSLISFLSISISVMTMISILSISQGFHDYLISNYKKIGTDLMWVEPNNNNNINNGIGFDLAAVDQVKGLSFVKNASPYSMLTKTIIINGISGNIALSGVNEDYDKIMNMKVYGRFISTWEYENGSNVCVISDDVRKNYIYKNIDPVGEQINISGKYYTIIGYVEPSDVDSDISTGIEAINSVYIPYTSLSKDNGNITVDVIKFDVSDVNQIKDYKNKIDALFKDLREKGLNFKTRSIEENLGNMEKMISRINIFFIIFIIITMIISGMGIMNVLLMSTVEKKWEIGLRKSIGASKKDILLQFLFETLYLSILGAIVGVIASSQIIAVLKNYEKTFYLSFSAVILSVVFCMIIGLFFGISPAIKAAKMEPLKCLEK